MRIPAYQVARSFRNGVAPGSTYVQPWVGWYCGYIICAGTSFVQCFAWSAKRGQMCLVSPTPCAVRLGITGAEHTRPCWYLCWYLFCTVLRLVSPGNVSLARARTRTGQPNAGKCAWFALPLAQFAWVSRALNILARVGTCAGTSFVQCFARSARTCTYLPVFMFGLCV